MGHALLELRHAEDPASVEVVLLLHGNGLAQLGPDSLDGVQLAAVRGEPDQLQAVRAVGGETSHELPIVVPHLRPLGLPLLRPGLRGVYGTRPEPLDHAPHVSYLQVLRFHLVGNSG